MNVVEAEPSPLREVAEQVSSLLYKDHLPVSQAVDLVLPQLELDPESTAFLVRYGLIYWLNNDRHYDIRREDSMWSHRKDATFQRFVQKSPHGEKAWAALLLSLEAADGSLQMLYDFSAEDWEHQRGIAQQMSAAWKRRATVCNFAAQTLRKSHKQTTRDLSEDKLLEIAEKVEETWLR